MARQNASNLTAEEQRLQETDRGDKRWRFFGPYLADRQWGTVREDYSPHGSAWDYFPHDHARSRAYRWGEDGIAGYSDEQSRLCFSVAMWNGHDPILKERFFGLTGPEGNHGEDVKELYYYLDATPTHSYLKMLYKYPQAAFPYSRLVDENRRRGKSDGEFEIMDTGVFDSGRYFDVFVEYAKADADDTLIRITVANRGPEEAAIHLLPQLWFRNTWSWGNSPESKAPSGAGAKPSIALHSARSIVARHAELGSYYLHAEARPQWLFCDNETNKARVFGVPNAEGFYKDAFDRFIVHGDEAAANPAMQGTKAGALFRLEVPAGGQRVIHLRLSTHANSPNWKSFDTAFRTRIEQADAFYEKLQAGVNDADARLVQRQAFAGMIWSKQFFYFDIPQWLTGDPAQPAPPAQRRHGRNSQWSHLNNADILSMPDKWEYPWYAAWDLAFHCIPLAQIDPRFAKDQLLLLTREWYMHPNGQLPAYEWAFGDVNPPVHAWATWKVYELDRQRTGRGDRAFLEAVFHKLLLNFTWWVNRKDLGGRNIFQGGFLGLDNIGVFDRSAQLPSGGHINQADGTSWMAMYSLNLMRIALELAHENATYQDLATKFFEHFLHIAAAMTSIGGNGEPGIDLWNNEDQFFYDVLSLPDGRHVPMKLRSMVGLIPLFAVEVLDADLLERVPEFKRRLEWFLNYRPDLAKLVSRWFEPCRHTHPQSPRSPERGSTDRCGETRLLSLLRGHRMKQLLKRMLDETEFLSDFGVRALSKQHESQPYMLELCGQTYAVRYQPGESDSGLFGGNSNWRGPIWFPVNYLIIDSLRQFHRYYGDEFRVECPTRSGNLLTLDEIADELSRRLIRIFQHDGHGRRPVLAYSQLLHQDPHFRDYVLFHEYFHGDTGRGVGASHQTGWTGLVATLIDETKQPAAASERARVQTHPPALAST